MWNLDQNNLNYANFYHHFNQIIQSLLKLNFTVSQTNQIDFLSRCQTSNETEICIFITAALSF